MRYSFDYCTCCDYFMLLPVPTVAVKICAVAPAIPAKPVEKTLRPDSKVSWYREAEFTRER